MKWRFVAIVTASLWLLGCSSLEENLAKLKSPHADKRIEAILWIEENIESETNRKLLIEAVEKDESFLVRSVALRLMARSGDQEYLPFILQALEDEHYLVKMEAAQALGTWGQEEKLAQLEKLLKNREAHRWARLKALKSIEHMKAKQAVGSLIELLASKEPDPAIELHTFVLLQKFTGENFGFDQAAWIKWHQKQ